VLLDFQFPHITGFVLYDQGNAIADALDLSDYVNSIGSSCHPMDHIQHDLLISI
jgi:hypothetical protein